MGKERRRVSREHVRENAKKGGGSGNNWFSMGEGISSWNPEKADSYLIDILPYEVKSDSHPDDVPKGNLWFKLPFKVHHGVGAKKESLVCPTSIGQRCPICEERDRLYKEDKDKYEDVLGGLRAQKFVAYNIINPDDKDKISIFVMSRGKFAAPLEKELQAAENEEHLGFYDVQKRQGRTLKVRFSDASFDGKKYIEATRFDFRERDDFDEEEVLNKTVCLEEALVVPSYDKMLSLFKQMGADTGEEEEPTTKEEKTPAKSEPEPRKPAPKDDDGDEDDDPPAKKSEVPAKKAEPEDDDDDPPPAKEKKAPATPTCPECGDEFDAEDAVNSKVTGKDYCSNKCRKKAEAKAEEAPAKEEKKAPAKKADDDDDDPPAKKEAPAKEEKAEKKGDKCPGGGTFGKDLDKLKHCEECAVWGECEEANDG